MALRSLTIVDDELPIRNELASYDWASMGLRCVGAASNGLSALDLCREKRPDLLLLDIMMPGMNGLELLKLLRKEMPRIVVVILSCYSDYAYLRTAMQLGARDYVLKANLCPQEMAALLKRLEAGPETEEAQASGRPTYRLEIENAIRLIQGSLGQALTLAFVAEQVGLSAKHFSRLFQRETQETFGDYLLKARIEEAKRLLRQTPLRIYEVGDRVGLPNYRYFSQQFKQATGMTPTAYKEQRPEGKDAP